MVPCFRTVARLADIGCVVQVQPNSHVWLIFLLATILAQASKRLINLSHPFSSVMLLESQGNLFGQKTLGQILLTQLDLPGPSPLEHGTGCEVSYS